MAAELLRRWLAHPLTASLKVDDPATTELRKRIIASKPILKSIYKEWYGMLARGLPAGEGRVVELGSGGGFAAEFIPGLITSEVFALPGVQLVGNGQAMPFANESLRAIVMKNVLHHMPRVRLFFAEATRCLRTGGEIRMIEPWVTPWSRQIYKRLHEEPFDAEAREWEFAESGPLSGANVALPWIVLSRDREQFDAEFPRLKIKSVQPMMPFRYIVSGGVGMRSLIPGFTQGVWAGLERWLAPQMHRLGMFALIVLQKM